MSERAHPRQVSRREFLRTGGLGAAALLAGAGAPRELAGGGGLELSGGHEATPTGHPTRQIDLVAREADWDLGTRRAPAWTFDGRVPGPEIRVRAGDRVRVNLRNELPIPTTIHWHGVPVPHPMDGVPVLTQPPVEPGERFFYDFTVDTPGTFWYHSHYGPQLDRGLFGPLVIEPRREELAYDREYVLVVDDWVYEPESAPAADISGMIQREVEMGLREAAPTERTQPRTTPPEGHGEAIPEPLYDAYTVNGFAAGAGAAMRARQGDRLRLRIINAQASGLLPLYLAGHRFTVTHTDGHPIEPLAADVILLGPGERSDVLVEADNPGVWALSSLVPDQRQKGLLAALRYDGVRARDPDATPPGRPFAVARYSDMRSLEPVAIPEPNRIYELGLSMRDPTRWTINGEAYPDTEPLQVREGERVELRMRNEGIFFHPMHLHGHFMDLVEPLGGAAASPLRKDTLLVQHQERHVVSFQANNPGPRWFFHCHHLYHLMGGMALEVTYV